ncbi:MAG: capsule assembly Wzi family protein [Bacteroides sp.]|nr:capsule assembly Wzi family protein [Bacteroides sp.]
MNNKLRQALLLFFCFSGICCGVAQNVSSYAEFGTSLHGGDHTPLWQVSKQQGLSSLKNNAYLRGAATISGDFRKWQYEAGADLVVATGFTSDLVIQQLYADLRYKSWGIYAGSKEMDSPLLNPELSSGGLTWSGNARPIPQIGGGLIDYIRLAPRVRMKASASFGWFTDNNYQKHQVGEGQWYTKSIKYSHRDLFFQFGVPQGKWTFDLGFTLDSQFGGYLISGNSKLDLGNKFINYLKAFIPMSGDEEVSSAERYFQGNFVGSEHFKLTYRNTDFLLSLYYENYFDDLSGARKQNGFDGLWSVEFQPHNCSFIKAVVMEYYQTTNQSGALHGTGHPDVGKPNGNDNYYNNGLYPGWVHWGMGIGNPLVASPIYNENGNMTFLYNRVKAFHLAWNGDISREWRYTAKLTYNQTWGTHNRPLPAIRENFSTFVGVGYTPEKLKTWDFLVSGALDMGEIYGDNLGMQVKVKKTF